MKLQPGDYVSTEGMSEEQYHAVCKAFMDAVAERGEYSTKKFMWDLVGWSKENDQIVHCQKKSLVHDRYFTRKLTVQQILEGNEQMNMTVQEAYKIMQANCGIEVGDTVKVLRKAEDGEMGWRNSWEPKMNAYIGCDWVVKTISDSDIRFKNDENYYWFPFFVLELVKKGKKLPDPIRISSEYKAMFREDGGIDVGCQKLSFDKLEEIYLTAKGVRDGY